MQDEPKQDRPHVSRQSEDEEGDVLAPIREACERAEAAMIAAVEAEPDRIWDPRDLRATAGGGTAAMIVLCRLANPEYDDRLMLTSDLKVARRAATPRVRDGSPTDSPARP
jgi:hypothetical protein